jgi:prephenate dehydrogenase
MCRWNREAVLSALMHYQAGLDTLINAVRQEDWTALEAQLQHGQAIRPDFL